jgi:hypothetical protein
MEGSFQSSTDHSKRRYPRCTHTLLDHVREHRGSGATEDPAQVVCRRLHGLRLLLVLRETADAVQDPVFVTGRARRKAAPRASDLLSPLFTGRSYV